MIIWASCTILRKTLTRNAKVATARVRGFRVDSHAASFALSTLLVLLLTCGIEPHPGPTDDQTTNRREGDSTSAANDGSHNDCGNSISCPTVNPLFAATNQHAQAVNRLESAQVALNRQRTHNTTTVRQRLAEVEKKLDERLRSLEDNNEILSADVGEISTTVEQLEDEIQSLKDKRRTLEEQLDAAEN